MENVTTSSRVYSFNAIQSHQSWMAKKIYSWAHWDASVEETLAVKLARKSTSSECVPWTQTCDMLYNKYCWCCPICAVDYWRSLPEEFFVSCSLQLLAISMSTPSAWESTYYCDYMFTLFCMELLSTKLYNLLIIAAHCSSGRYMTLAISCKCSKSYWINM